MADIKFSTGLVTYNINGAVTVSFNPTDTTFVEKLYETFNALDKKQEEQQAELDAATDKSAIFDIARARDTEMRAMIDGIFEVPVWANFLLAIMDEIDTSFAREQKLTNPRINKYTAKYRK